MPPARKFLYKAFLSYNQKADGMLASKLERALEQFAKPWYLRRNFDVFRDATDLSANPALWPTLQRYLDESEFYVLLASPESAASVWVRREMNHWWTSGRGRERVLLVLTGGTIVWNESASDFDWSSTTALSRESMSNRFDQEPLWVDCSWARGLEPGEVGKHPMLADRVADLASSLLSRPKSELFGEDLRQHRRQMRLARSAIVVLVALCFLSLLFWSISHRRGVALGVSLEEERKDRQALLVSNVKEKRARADAELKARIATSRQLAAEASSALDGPFDVAIPLAAEALRTQDTVEARRVLTRALMARPGLMTYLNPADGVLSSAAFSPDGKTLAVGVYPDDPQRGAGRVDFWGLDEPPARTVHSFPLPARKPGEQLRVLAMQPNAPLLAIGSSHSVLLYDARRRQSVAGPLEVDAGHLESLAFSADGTILVGGTQEPGSLVFWDVFESRQIGEIRFQDAEGSVSAIAFAHEGKTLAVSLVDSSGPKLRGRILVVDAATRHRLSTQSVELSEGPAYALEYSPDGKTLAAGFMSDGSPQGGVVFCNSAATERVGPPVAIPEGVVEHFAFGRDGTTLVVAYRSLFGEDSGLLTCDMLTRRRLNDPPIAIGEGSVTALAVNRDRRTLAVGHIGTRTRRESAVSLWDIAMLRDRARLSVELAGGSKGRSAVSPDGRTVAFERYPLVLWDLDSAPPSRTAMRSPGVLVDGLAFSPDGRTLASGFRRDRKIRAAGVALWNVDTHKPRAKPFLAPEAGDEPCVVRFSPDGTIIAAGFQKAGIILWHAATGTRVTQRPIPLAGVNALAFSPDGTTLALGLGGFEPGSRNEVVLWDLASGRPAPRQPLAGLDRHVLSLAFSPDGTTLTAGFLGGNGISDGFAWGNLAEGRRSEPVIRPVRDGAQSLAFSPDGSMLAVGSSQYVGSSVQLWDAVSLARLLERPIPVAGPLVSDVTFCSGGRLLAVCSYDQPSNRSRWTFWDIVPAADRARRAGEIANRNLSAEEWSRYLPDQPYHRTFDDLTDGNGVKPR
jgi:WD40 repeat protein